MRRPGRPRKYKGAVKRIGFELPYDKYVEMEKARGSMPWGDFFIELFEFAKAHGRFST